MQMKGQYESKRSRTFVRHTYHSGRTSVHVRIKLRVVRTTVVTGESADDLKKLVVRNPYTHCTGPIPCTRQSYQLKIYLSISWHVVEHTDFDLARMRGAVPPAGGLL